MAALRQRPQRQVAGVVFGRPPRGRSAFPLGCLVAIALGCLASRVTELFINGFYAAWSPQPRDTLVALRDRAMDDSGRFITDGGVNSSDEEAVWQNTSSPVGSDGLPMRGSPPYKAKMALLRRITELERGSKASALDDKKVRALGEKLLTAAQEHAEWRLSFPADLPSLAGRWKLLYTSGFAGREDAGLGGLRGGPSLNSPALEVGDIFQVYRIADSRADTEVTLRPPTWLRDTGLLSQLPFTSGNPDSEITLTQQFDVASEDTLRFAFTDGKVANKLFEQLAALRFPMAPLGFPADTSQDGPFTDTLRTTYCDGDLRIGIGGRFGEFRVFRREQ
eukprot:TRINITY_DN63326_c0_g1_i1.p1 TRINITY_DN63326_c0_g1~~TRINITY_DN63326_c0_g1_i1.p1  ORF type:complete len:348 (+),score=31.88 TRINITY_DN63326_c0_g1_i1:41-1045(+)